MTTLKCSNDITTIVHFFHSRLAYRLTHPILSPAVAGSNPTCSIYVCDLLLNHDGIEQGEQHFVFTLLHPVMYEIASEITYFFHCIFTFYYNTKYLTCVLIK